MTDAPDRNPVTLLEEIFPNDTNPYGTAFGGKIVALMDRAAGLAASKYAHQHFVTASIDAIQFKLPVRQGEIAEVVARVVYTSAHTCGIAVQVFAVDKIAWQRKPCCQGIFFMVATSPDGASQPVPGFSPGNQEEQWLWRQAAEARRKFQDS